MKKWMLIDRETKRYRDLDKEVPISWAITYNGNIIAILKDQQQAKNLVDLHNKDVDTYRKLVDLIKKGVCSFLDSAT